MIGRSISIDSSYSPFYYNNQLNSHQLSSQQDHHFSSYVSPQNTSSMAEKQNFKSCPKCLRQIEGNMIIIIMYFIKDVLFH